ncbi:MAG: hypothetical protein ACRDJ4_04355 [Actinomycetota bacterium]
MRHPVSRVDGASGAGISGSAPWRRPSGDPGQQGDEHAKRGHGRPEAGEGASRARRPAAIASAKGAAESATLRGPSTRSMLASVTRYSSRAIPKASGIAPGIVRAGSRTSSPSVAIRA